MVTNEQLHQLQDLLAKLKTRALGLDDFEKLVEQKRHIKKLIEENQEFVKELFDQHSVKLNEEDPRFFDSTCKEEDTRAVNEKLAEFNKKEVALKKFLDKKKLQQLKHENDLTIEEYELLTEAFFVETKEKEPKEAKTKKK